jgi:hypothetical protein
MSLHYPCKFNVDLGNGSITKSYSTCEADCKQSRAKSIVSVDGVPSIDTTPIPFSSTFYEQYQSNKQDYSLHNDDHASSLFNSNDRIERQQWPYVTWNTMMIVSVGTVMSIVVVLLVIFLV